MKNSKPFPCPDAPDWLAHEFVTALQLSACRALYQCHALDLALTCIDLSRLQTSLATQRQTITTTYLDPVEQHHFSSFTFAKRQLEWIGGRMAAKQAALTLLNQPAVGESTFLDYRIEAEASGRPYLSRLHGPSTNLPAISISHSHGLAGALAVTGDHCGLDLQRITAKVTSVRDRFVSSDEWHVITSAPALWDLDEATLLTLLWSAKEALRKAIGCHPLLGFTELTLTRLTGNLQTGLTGHFTSCRLNFSLAPTFLVVNSPFVCALTLQ